MTGQGLDSTGMAQHGGRTSKLMFLSWLYLIIGWLILAAYAVVWTRANPGHLMRRGRSPARNPPRWSYLLLFVGTAVAVLGAAELRQSVGWWVALLLFVAGGILAQMIPIAVHNRSVRRAAHDPHP